MIFNRELFLSFFWSAVQKWGSAFSAIVFFVFLARLLTPDDFGLAAMVVSIQLILEPIVGLGFGSSLIQQKSIDKNYYNTAFTTAFVISISLMLLIYNTSSLLANILNFPQIINYLKVYSVSFLFIALIDTQEKLLRREFNFKALAIRKLTGEIVGGIVGLILALEGYGAWSLVWKNLINKLMNAIILWSVSSWKLRFHFSTKHFIKMFRFGIPVVGYDLSKTAKFKIDNYLIGAIIGLETLGIYHFSKRIVDFLSTLITAIIRYVAFPYLARIHSDIKQLNSFIFSTMMLNNLLVFPIFFAMFSLSNEVIQVIFGPKWVQSTVLIRILIFSGIIRSTSFLNSAVFLSIGKPNVRLVIEALDLLATISILSIVLFYTKSILICVIGLLLKDVVMFTFSSYLLFNISKVSVSSYIKAILLPLTPSLILLLSLSFFSKLKLISGSNYFSLAVLLLFAALIYLISFRILLPNYFYKVSKLLKSLK